jgi:hypothetical protein
MKLSSIQQEEVLSFAQQMATMVKERERRYPHQIQA